MDGGWLENQAAAATLAEMQKGFAGKTVVEADNANWFFTNVYGPLAASQAAGAAPIIKAWLAGEELPATFP